MLSSRMWIRFFSILGVLLNLILPLRLVQAEIMQSTQEDARQYIAKAHTSYHSFHSIDVSAQVYAKNGQTILFEDPDQDLYVQVFFSDHSRRSGVKSQIEIKFEHDANYPNLPQKWLPLFEKVVAEDSTQAYGMTEILKRNQSIKIPGSVFPADKMVHKVRLSIILQTKVKFGWASRQNQESREFYLARYPHFEKKRLPTLAVHKLNTWARARGQAFQLLRELFSDFMDPTYKIKDGQTLHDRLGKDLQILRNYTSTFYDEVDFKAYMTEFVAAYTSGIEEKIDFPVETTTFLNVPDKTFHLKGLLPQIENQTLNFPKEIQPYRYYLALLRLMGSELKVLEKLDALVKLSSEEVEKMSMFQAIESRSGYIDRMNLLKKTTLSQIESYNGLGFDLKRMLGWSNDLKDWLPLERSPVFDLANSDFFTAGSQFVTKDVIQAVRAIYHVLFFVLASENYYADVLRSLVETGLSVFQLSPPEITFQVDQDVLFNGQEGVLIARVYNPSPYVSLDNIHLLMEKNHLRRLLFYRGDNLQTIGILKPKEVRYVFFRFTTIGIGTDYPEIKIRYNRDFETKVRVTPIQIQRKDEFLTKAMDKAQEVQGDTLNSFTRLKEKLLEFQDQLDQSPARKLPE